MTAQSRKIVESIQGPADFQRTFGVSRETIERLKIYEALLRKWQPTINLVAPSTMESIWHRHFADSAQILRLVPLIRPIRWLDLGAGAGFPGLVSAVLLCDQTASRVILVESDSRKAAFLREVVRETGIAASVTVDIAVSRIETLANQARIGAVDVISARALAPLPKLLRLALPFFQSETTGLFLKGREVGAEVAAAQQVFEFDAELQSSLTDLDAGIVVIRNLVGRS
jgi:16S rRNA (guanine527-N7)-methyltransferase